MESIGKIMGTEKYFEHLGNRTSVSGNTKNRVKVLAIEP